MDVHIDFIRLGAPPPLNSRFRSLVTSIDKKILFTHTEMNEMIINYTNFSKFISV